MSSTDYWLTVLRYGHNLGTAALPANFDAAVPACAAPLLWWIMPEAVCQQPFLIICGPGLVGGPENAVLGSDGVVAGVSSLHDTYACAVGRLHASLSDRPVSHDFTVAFKCFLGLISSVRCLLWP